MGSESVDRGAYLKLIPDVLLPSQFFELVGTQTLSSEQRLMLAVLADAISILRGHRVSLSHDKRNPFSEASTWVFADRMASSLSFDHVCEALGLNAECLRRRLSELVTEHGGDLRKLNLKGQGPRQGPTVNRIGRR
jgi:hypothetical protein